ncbi:MAG: phosphotransferase family protein [Gammaproteobacteria bacterium]|nr:phosphotransferase family protein [Gammaproteobacteria bacterium]
MTAPGSPLPQWRLLEPLAATPVSRTWKVMAKVAAGEQFAVLRIDEPGARRLGLDRHAEPGVLRSAAAAGLGPPVLHADADRGLLLTGWLPGQVWTAADLNDPGNLERAAALLRRLHATPLPAPVVDLGDAIARYAAVAGPPCADLALRAHRQLARSLSAETEPLCFCHNDPTPGNFIALQGGDLRLIDWEYAGLCYRGFDLAGLAVGAGLATDQVRRLLTAYRGRPPTPVECDRHRSWEVLCRTVGRLWQAALGARPD